METRKARRSWIEVLQKLRDHGCKPRLLYPAKLSFTINGENKVFQDKNKFKQYVATNPALQKVLENHNPRNPTMPTITQTASDPSQAKLKEGKQTHSTTPTKKRKRKEENRSQQPLVIIIT